MNSLSYRQSISEKSEYKFVVESALKPLGLKSIA